MRGNRRTRSSRRVRSAKSLRGGMRSKRSRNSRKTRNLRKTKTSRRNRKSRRSRRSRRTMKGGSLGYAALPCDANGSTDWNSTQQFGPESCVSYGTDGAENDARAAGLGVGSDYLEGLGIMEGTGSSAGPVTAPTYNMSRLLESAGVQTNAAIQQAADNLSAAYTSGDAAAIRTAQLALEAVTPQTLFPGLQ